MYNEKTINSFDEYIEYTEKFKGLNYFRGQANKDWCLIPSLFRNQFTIEDEIDAFKKEQYIEDNVIESTTVSKILYMQHYNKPTRILDLTVSNLSALFFSIDNDDETNNDGVVYIFNKDTEFNAASIEIEFLIQPISCGITKVSNLCKTFFEALDDSELKTMLSKNYIIQYDPNFSYTNNRAFIQGGTGIFYGYGIEEDNITLQSNNDVNNMIIEKIIIPANLKAEIKKILNSMGYCHDYLYNNFEVINSEKVSLTEKNITYYENRNKYCNDYKVNTIFFERMDLQQELENELDKLYSKYNKDLKVFSRVYYDENDLANNNLIATSRWSDENHYIVQFYDNYYAFRFHYINQQLSKNTVIKSFKEALTIFIPFYQEIQNVFRNVGLEGVKNILENEPNDISSAFFTTNDIGHCGESDIEKKAEEAYDFIILLSSLFPNYRILASRKESRNYINYWVEDVLKKCEVSYNRLDNIFKDI